MRHLKSLSSKIAPENNVSIASVELRSRSYRPDIDGLRSLAILSVVLYHARLQQISGGFTGVDVFFAISGYLIGGHIYSELKSGAFRFSRFYRNRAKRILPALYFVLLAVLAGGLAVLSPHELRDLAKYTFFTTVSASNIILWHTSGYFTPTAETNPLLMTWSLGVEEQFYLVIPLILVLLAKVSQRLIFPLITLMSIVSFAVATYQVTRRPDSAFYLASSRAWELGSGVALAISEVEGRKIPALQSRVTNQISAWIGLVLVVVPVFALTSATVFPGPAALPSVAGAVILLSSNGAWVNKNLLSFRPLVYVGRVSYSFYLVHWPLLAILRLLAGRSLPESWELAVLGIAFGLAVLSYNFVERPFRASKLPAKPLLLRYGVVSIVILLVSGIVYKSNGIPSRFPLAAAIDAAAAPNDGPSHDVCLVKSGTNLPNLTPRCVGVDSRRPAIALWGDSHASAIATALRQASASQGYAMEEFAKTSCPPLHGIGRSYRSQPADLSGCIEFNDAVLHRLRADPQIKVVVLFAYWEGAFDPRTDQGKLAEAGHAPSSLISQTQSEALLKKSLTETISALLMAHKEVIVFGDTPVFNVDPIWRMRSRAISVRGEIYSILNRTSNVDPGLDQAFDDDPPQTAERLLLRQTVLAIPGARFWDPRTKLCDDASLCVYRDGMTPLFADGNHLNQQGALRILKDLNIQSNELTNVITQSPL